jgi:hypothetical protein
VDEVPRIEEADRRILRALFIANEDKRPTIRSFRVQHRDSRENIDRLVETKLIRIERDHYRLSLRGLHETDLDRARYYIGLFNDAIPALQAAYAATESGRCARADIFRRMNLPGPVEEKDVESALWYLLNEIPGGALTGWSWDSSGSLLEIGLGEPILDLQPLPLVASEPTPDSAAGRGHPTQSEPVKMSNASNSAVKVFVSHSSRDKHLVELVVELLVAALRIPKGDIRCTSVAGCRLPAGANASHVLVEDIQASTVFVALLTRDSVDAPFVLFELGARWGQRRSIIPILGPRAGFELLPSPVKDLHTLRTGEETDLMQLVREVATALNLEPEPPEAYHRAVRALASYRADSN